ncbi:MAG: glycosyltransferase [Propionibacteriales bacterium]|nr:glycosyltransferase [Propionibacteriales bacterium]
MTEASWPPVSVIMPILDEERHLADAVDRVLAQDYPGELELVIALGTSTDRTSEIADGLAEQDGRVRLIDNPTGRTPAGLNAAIGAAKHDIIVRVDGHGLLSPGYIARAVELLESTGAANVGGIMDAAGESPFAQAVARGMTSRAGIGGARFHLGGAEGPAETVYLGVFRRSVLDRLGGYNEHFTRAQDWELNHRIREAGETVWFSPDLSVTYRPRQSLTALAKQFFGSGQWRREVVRHHPDTTNVRYLAPPVVTAAIGVGTLAGLIGLVAGPRWLELGWLAPVGYGAGVLVASAVESRGLPASAKAWFPAVLATMHLSWGTGFLVGPGRSDHETPTG